MSRQNNVLGNASNRGGYGRRSQRGTRHVERRMPKVLVSVRVVVESNRDAHATLLFPIRLSVARFPSVLLRLWSSIPTCSSGARSKGSKMTEGGKHGNMAIRAAMAARSCRIHRRRCFTLATFTSLAFAECRVAYAYNQETNSRARQRTRTRSSLSSAPVSVAAAEIEKLTHHKALWDESEPLSRARRKLKPRHRALFDTDADDDDDMSLSLFNEFCTVLCNTGAMPRKEIFETWSAALYIHETFGDKVRRVCDVAAGHSLLAWSLLVLDDNNENTDKHLTVLCVDRRMPPSAEVIRLAMIDRWPHLEERFDFVEGSLEQLQPHPSCLLASVHACGGLSDLLIASAASSQSPIALVPCCHTRKKKALLGASDFARAEYGAIIDADEVKDLTTMLDMAREAALRNAGFSLCTQYLDDLL